LRAGTKAGVGFMSETGPALAPLPRRRGEDRQRTRAQLLEAAGRLFAEKGFDRATGKEICERAGTNTAAINYYFGGMDGLYAAVLEEANNRLVSLQSMTSAVAAASDAKAKLQALLELAVDKLTGPVSSSWVLGVIGRELVAPSPALDELRERQGVPKARILMSIVGELMGLAEDHPAVARGCMSIMAPCLMLLITDRLMLKRVFPSLSIGPQDAPALVRHLVAFALAGLAAIAEEARSEAK
jgi:TetR/AcrR family transcriptional regulator, regulator of cefoperazone and chloramphenicol sensitivity